MHRTSTCQPAPTVRLVSAGKAVWEAGLSGSRSATGARRGAKSNGTAAILPCPCGKLQAPPQEVRNSW
jgi:hypothetical protein